MQRIRNKSIYCVVLNKLCKSDWALFIPSLWSIIVTLLGIFIRDELLDFELISTPRSQSFIHVEFILVVLIAGMTIFGARKFVIFDAALQHVVEDGVGWARLDDADAVDASDEARERQTKVDEPSAVVWATPTNWNVVQICQSFRTCNLECFVAVMKS